MDYSKYKESRDLTWKILISQNISSLPVQVSRICKNYGIPIFGYSKNSDLIRELHYEEIRDKNDGFTIKLYGKPLIFYNDSNSHQRSRFTVAHELGHILLGHIGRKDLINQEPSDEATEIEQAANVFASRLLAPACVLWGLQAHSPEEIMKYCDITYTAANFRAKRMAELYLRERRFIETKGKSCFLMSPLERQVYNQFLEYINRPNHYEVL